MNTDLLLALMLKSNRTPVQREEVRNVFRDSDVKDSLLKTSLLFLVMSGLFGLGVWLSSGKILVNAVFLGLMGISIILFVGALLLYIRCVIVQFFKS